MTISLYQVSAPVFIQGLKGLAGVVDKASAHVAAKNLDPNALLQARLFPDMFNFTRQIQIACDFPKGAMARLSGQDAPAWDDTEVTFDDLKARIQKTIAYVEAIDPASVDGQEDREIILVRRGVESVVKAQPYLLEQAMPNFYFHISTAYAILRHNGVEIGKKNFLGTA